ncbi:MAG: PQQ-dependent sugar dehydrogenase [Verrucomicrobia bacterium]|nr:PQQ-dependent sugar dehydrogenase [Verrucomicrobiota bacterium]
MKPSANWRAVALLALCCGVAGAQPRVAWTTSHVQGTPEPPPPFIVERIEPGLTFTHPLDITPFPGSKRIVVLEETGRIFSYVPGAGKVEPFGELVRFHPEINRSYALTFHPRFAENRFVFTWGNFDLKGADNREDGTQIIRFRVTDTEPPALDLGSAKVIISWRAGGHNGGTLRFGPDGLLYISTGDAAKPDPPDAFVTGQDIGDLLASVLRIDVDHPEGNRAYGIPKDNPFIHTPNARGEVWAYGLRNPWRMSFDPKSGELYAGDVGWELWEMIYRIRRGGNYGWSITEGGKQDVRPDRLRGPTPILPPLVTHSHEEAASITGGEFYHGDRLPELKGRYVYGDWQMGTFWSLRAEGDRVTEHREIARSSLMPAGFGTAPDGEFLITDYSGGGLWRLARNPEAGRKSSFPRKLSETGIFADVARQTPAPGVLPFAIHAPRWADHATAERWVGFPGQAGVTVPTEAKGVALRGHWSFPAGAVLAKTYALELERGNPATRRRIETQILHYDGSLWGTYSYRWNAEQTDAELVPKQGDEATFTVKDRAAPGGEMQQRWRFFSRSECARCHTLINDFAQGFSAPQLDVATTAAGGRQLDAFTRLGLAPDEPSFADPHGPRGSLETRARSYLHVNCGVCHRFNSGGAVPTFLNIETPLKEAKLIDFKPVQGDFGLPDARVVASGDPMRSVLFYRMASAGRGHMPYLGGKLVDDRGLLLVRNWIAGLGRKNADLSPATRTQRNTERQALTKLKAGDAASLPKLLATSSGALSVLFAIIDDTLPADLRAQAIAQGGALVDPVRRDLFERFLPESQRRKVLGNDFKAADLLAMNADVKRGQTLFAAVCVTCHRVNGAGTDFGPDLSHIGTKWNRAAMIEQILTPSKVIDPPWLLTTIELRNGESKAGFVFARSDRELTLKLPGGVSEKIPTAQILKTTTSPDSVMPEGLLQSLTAREAADLLAYLDSLK